MTKLTFEAYKLITDELWHSEDGFTTLKALALVSRPLLDLCRAYLFRQITITIRSEGWSTYTKDKTQYLTPYCEEHAISFYLFLATRPNILKYVLSLELISENENQGFHPREGWIGVVPCLVMLLNSIKRLRFLDINAVAGTSFNWRALDPEIQRSLISLVQRQEGQPISLGLFAVKGICERDFLTLLTTCTDVRLYFVELWPIPRAPSSPLPWIFPSGSLLSLRIGPCVELGAFSLITLLSDPNWLCGVEYLTLETHRHNVEAYWELALACRGTLCHLAWRLVVSPTGESHLPIFQLSAHVKLDPRESWDYKAHLEHFPKLRTITLQTSIHAGLDSIFQILSSVGPENRIHILRINLDGPGLCPSQCPCVFDVPPFSWTKLEGLLVDDKFKNLRKIILAFNWSPQFIASNTATPQLKDILSNLTDPRLAVVHQTVGTLGIRSRRPYN